MLFAATASALFVLNQATGQYDTFGSGAVRVTIAGSGVEYKVAVCDAGGAGIVSMPLTAKVRPRGVATGVVEQ